MSASWLRMDLSPLAGRDFRLLFGSSTVSLLMGSEVAPRRDFIVGGASELDMSRIDT